ncbi:MAG TPA: hypothetical protein VHM16_08385 [Rubrobacteraceae bacterium]|nr:hypothetical protein [Rubrobacteraceae bacterium]
MSFPEDPPETSVHASVVAGVRAAGILEEACRESLEGSDTLHLMVVRDLAQNIQQELDALSRRIASGKPAGLIVDAALACADLATLAACNLTAMSPEEAHRTVDAVHLAARAANSLAGSVGEESPNNKMEYLMRDARGAKWRADLASRQADELRASGEAG